MSTGPIETVDPAIRPANVVDNVNDHTPDPQTPPGVEGAPNPPTEQDSMTELRETVTNLATAVVGIQETLTSLVAKTNPDASPAKVPWTHRGGSK